MFVFYFVLNNTRRCDSAFGFSRRSHSWMCPNDATFFSSYFPFNSFLTFRSFERYSTAVIFTRTGEPQWIFTFPRLLRISDHPFLAISHSLSLVLLPLLIVVWSLLSVHRSQMHSVLNRCSVHSRFLHTRTHAHRHDHQFKRERILSSVNPQLFLLSVVINPLKLRQSDKGKTIRKTEIQWQKTNDIFTIYMGFGASLFFSSRMNYFQSIKRNNYFPTSRKMIFTGVIFFCTITHEIFCCLLKMS